MRWLVNTKTHDILAMDIEGYDATDLKEAKALLNDLI